MATREEELQKKREEAERKARRGEIDPTHEFTFQVRGFVAKIAQKVPHYFVYILFIVLTVITLF